MEAIQKRKYAKTALNWPLLLCFWAKKNFFTEVFRFFASAVLLASPSVETPARDAKKRAQAAPDAWLILCPPDGGGLTEALQPLRRK